MAPFQFAVTAARLSLSHSSPDVSGIAGWIGVPVEVMPNRKMVHEPAGGFQDRVPSGLMFGLRSNIFAGSMVMLAGMSGSAESTS